MWRPPVFTRPAVKDEVTDLVQRLAGISPDIPFHIMRFIPLENTDAAAEPSIAQSEQLCRNLRKYMKHVYLFNSPGTSFLDTSCSSCGKTILKRQFYGPMGAKLKQESIGPKNLEKCPYCGTNIAVTGKMSETAYKEKGFEGGYPFTRALEIIEAILIAIGITNKRKMIKVWSRGILQAFLPYSF